jgi:two-component system sensor histidine kinase RegB
MSLINYDVRTGEHLGNLRRLISLRWLALAGLGVLILISPGVLAIPLPQSPMWVILALAGLLNALTDWRTRRARSATPGDLFGHLLIDVSALGALCFFSGGATNPLISLLLLPVAIAALTLPTRCVAAIGLTATIVYSLLMLYFIPLPINDASRATQLHLIGMWLTFVVSALMIAWLVVRMTGQIRERDAQLAAAREQALRDERILAIGTLAAGAAHELGTPLGTMALLAGELSKEPGLSAAIQDDLALMRQQIQVCKGIITRLAHRAGADRLENPLLQPLDHWLDTLRQQWHSSRPDAASQLDLRGALPAPLISSDPRLQQAVLNLLNNAADASPQPITISLDWNPAGIIIEVRDRGPGFPAAVLERGGEVSFPPHAQGTGIGLVLTRSALLQLGGRLTLSNPDEGGASARIDLPLACR